MACKFKVGDKIIGNKEASKHYGITITGWIGEVLEIDCDSRFGDIYVKGEGFMGNVKSNCFDLYTPHQGKILIMVDEKDPNKIVARDLITGKKAEAKCNPKDEWDFEKGAKLAFSRLYPESEKKEEKKPWTGKVICVRADPGCRLFTAGKMYTVDKGYLRDNVSPWITCACYSVEDVNDMIVRYGWCNTEFIEYKGGLE